ncbi:iron complex transport system substrate-binding protein [Cohnella sp. OV330]|uniref:ABC transporter substrate-binding protein n=1 Tax=Cohnella sp. OV330 TaxID=1855288 RepID=UPI0008E6F893|nr:ABC transporter substrate-binding protein [Cohnella sp. OV330]SFA94411.1 iron complex transport system substrate-binding protein [Cohnella sp. OV330]
MRANRNWMVLAVLLLTVFASACGSNANKDASPSESAGVSASQGTASQPASPEASSSSDAAAKKITDAKGREVEVPTDPKRIVYVCSDPGDLLALGVRPVGASLSVVGSQVAYGDQLQGIADVGYPADLEKVTAQDPDLIIFNDWDEQGLAPLEKIAPTVAIAENGGFDRMREVAGVLGKEAAADSYIAAYDEKVKQTKDLLAQKGKQGQSATVLLLMGKVMYVMGHQGLSVSLYDALGYVPPAKVQSLIDGGERFAEISVEVMSDYIGDELYILKDEEEETKAQAEALFTSSLWKSLPAVKTGQVHAMDSQWNFDDPVTRTMLLDELQRMNDSAG